MFPASNNLFNAIGSTIRSARARLESASRMASSSSSREKSSILIFLHGLGDQGSSWQMQLEPMLPSHVKCICPTAPIMPVTLNLGMRMNSWFDLRSLDPNDPEDEEGILAASKRIHELIDDQHSKLGIPHDRIMLGGFSQGGALALYAALTYPEKLAGVVALSCWLPLHKKVPSIISDTNKTLPVLQCHGDADFVVPLQWGTMSSVAMSDFLDKTKYSFKVYNNLSHSSSPAELGDVMRFIGSHLPKK